jgi:hypothetical protein
LSAIKTKCLCGHEITTNTWKIHLKHKHCSLNTESKTFIMNILDIKTKNCSAWLKSEEANALCNTNWFVSVIQGQIKLEDWSFETPRKVGEVRPITAYNMSISRKGTNNPCSKTKPKYDIALVKKRAKELFEHMKGNKVTVASLHKTLEQEFPFYLYNCPQIPYKPSRFGFNDRNAKWAFLLDISLEELVDSFHKQKGKFIIEGQRKSPNYSKILNAGQKALRFHGHISMPHKILYEMILSVDKEAIMEYHVSFGDTWRSYDVFSPRLKLYIEMHGRIWHAPSKLSGKMSKIVAKNIENDKLKKNLAINLCGKYIEFWDDQADTWSATIKKLYGVESISYGEAKSHIDFEKK